MKPLRTYNDLTLDARRLYDGAKRKLAAIKKRRQPLFTEARRARKELRFDDAKRAEDRVQRLYDAQSCLERVKDEILGRRYSWSETGIPVEVDGETRVYHPTPAERDRHATSLWNHSGTVTLRSFPADADALLSLLEAAGEASLLELEKAQREVERDRRNVKSRRDPHAHWRSPEPPDDESA